MGLLSLDPAPDVIPFHLTLLNYLNTEFTLYINTEVMQYSAPVVLLLIVLVLWDRCWSVDVKLHFVQLETVSNKWLTLKLAVF